MFGQETIGGFFKWLGESILAGLEWIWNGALQVFGHGVRYLMIASAFAGFGIFLFIRQIIKYTPFGLDTEAAVQYWAGIGGANASFFAWVFYDVLALDYFVFMVASLIGLILGAWAVYLSAAMVNHFFNRL